MADDTPPDDFNLRQHHALAALIAEPTIRKAAAAAEVPERTLYTWLKEPAFRAAYAAMRREAVGQAVARLQGFTSDAAGALQEVLSDKKAPAAVRVQAARVVLEFAIKAVELDDLQQRLDALEAAYAAKR